MSKRVKFAFFLDLKSAYKTLLRNKVRSLLTILGIIIGVGSVIATVSIGQGASVAIQSSINSMGSNLLIILPGSSSLGGIHTGFGVLPTLTLGDVHAIRKLPAVKTDSGNLGMPQQVIWRGNNWSTLVMGASSTYTTIRDWPVAQGTFFNHEQVASAANVAVIGNTAATELFGLINPIGHIILIHNVPFTVIGLLSIKGFNAFGQDQDDIVVIPITTMLEKIAGTTWVHAIAVSAKSNKDTAIAQSEITALLRQRHHIPLHKPDDFFVRNISEIAQAANSSANTFTILLGSIAAVSLLVGGIGIMNIMLVSVTERTKEIGIRMAVGAKKGDILKQFLIESSVLSLFGGILGIGLGFGISSAITAFSPLKTIVTTEPIVISLIFSLCVGIFFGFYPAFKASRMNPVEALRYE
ncbi:MAG: ABC transporter permease [Deltaproteobacteria bacterium]|jgi:putative ABC transport system permease protein|nr:ABC transporter permease [Deltaproteobacteria bacterium]MCL5880720.1 ABC transporter permease [Deltaproteobacteria bacterium]MDA8304197.1 ABC transporter permease [Deltaproteobacteria bacterium]